MPKFIEALEKRVDEARDVLDETLTKTTDKVKERVSAMRARVDHYIEDCEDRDRVKRRDSHKNLAAVKGPR